jgi:hypothetical protein
MKNGKLVGFSIDHLVFPVYHSIFLVFIFFPIFFKIKSNQLVFDEPTKSVRTDFNGFSEKPASFRLYCNPCLPHASAISNPLGDAIASGYTWPSGPALSMVKMARHEHGLTRSLPSHVGLRPAPSRVRALS